MKTGEAESEELIEELLCEVRDVAPRELRHVLELVRVAKGYMTTSAMDR